MIKEYYELIRKIGDDGTSLRLLKEEISTFYIYVSKVCEYCSVVKTAEYLYEGSAAAEAIMDIDKQRTACHNAAISACGIINRMCDKYEVKRFCPENTDDRHEAAKFAGEFVRALYLDGIGEGTD